MTSVAESVSNVDLSNPFFFDPGLTELSRADDRPDGLSLALAFGVVGFPCRAGRMLSRCVYSRLYTRGGIGGRGSMGGRFSWILSLIDGRKKFG